MLADGDDTSDAKLDGTQKLRVPNARDAYHVTLKTFDDECSSFRVSDSSQKNRKRFLTSVINVRSIFCLILSVILSVQNPLLF